MLNSFVQDSESMLAIERYVMAAICDAREVYDAPAWRAWAEHWIAGRDRSFASARKAHRMAREERQRELAGLLEGAQSTSETRDDRAETPAELAAWAAGLALVTAPVAPDLTAPVRRIFFSLRTWLEGFFTAGRPSLAPQVGCSLAALP